MRPIALLLGLLTSMPLAWGQRPSDADSAALIERSRQKALEYVQSLPDFVCNEVVRRYSAAADGHKAGGWVATDTLTIRLAYFEQKEEHKLELINGKPTDRKYFELSGGTGTGEFGGVLRMIFDPDSQGAFEWQSWKNVRKHRAAVYEYAVSAAHSPYYLELVPSPLSFGANGLFFTKYLSIVSVFRWWLSEFRSWSNLNGRFPHPFPWLWTHLSHRPIRTLFLFVTCPA